MAQGTSAFGDIDVTIRNGPGPAAARALDVTPDDVTAAVDSLVQPHVRLARLVLPGMRQHRWGRVLAIGSSGIVEPLRSLALSNLAGAALAGYLKILAAEVAADGITVNLLLPGRIATDRLTGIDEFVAEQSGQSLAAVQAQGQREVPAGPPRPASTIGTMTRCRRRDSGRFPPDATGGPTNSARSRPSCAASRPPTSPVRRCGATADSSGVCVRRLPVDDVGSTAWGRRRGVKVVRGWGGPGWPPPPHNWPCVVLFTIVRAGGLRMATDRKTGLRQSQDALEHSGNWYGVHCNRRNAPQGHTRGHRGHRRLLPGVPHP